jgi:Homing endonuclease associated repeat
MTKQAVIARILQCKEHLGHTPTRVELMRFGGVPRRQVRLHFGSYKKALEACKLQRVPTGHKVKMEVLFRDWAGIARALKRIPTMQEYVGRSQYSIQPVRARFGSWLRVPAGMRQYAEEQGLMAEWIDVMEMIQQWTPRQRLGPQTSELPDPPKILVDRPMYGAFTGLRPLICSPTNESGVIFLFGAVAEQLGFLVLRLQTEYPDCEAWRVVGKDRLQRVRIEIEYESRNFLRHMHDPAGCDLIVCWEHNWPECPLEVVELKTAVSNQPSAISEGKNL